MQLPAIIAHGLQLIHVIVVERGVRCFSVRHRSQQRPDVVAVDPAAAGNFTAGELGKCRQQVHQLTGQLDGRNRADAACKVGQFFHLGSDGIGDDIAIIDLAKLVAETVGFEGAITTDPSKPDGTPRKLVDVSRIKETGWEAKVDFRAGLAAAYQDFLKSIQTGDARL